MWTAVDPWESSFVLNTGNMHSWGKLSLSLCFKELTSFCMCLVRRSKAGKWKDTSIRIAYNIYKCSVKECDLLGYVFLGWTRHVCTCRPTGWATKSSVRRRRADEWCRVQACDEASPNRQTCFKSHSHPMRKVSERAFQPVNAAILLK